MPDKRDPDTNHVTFTATDPLPSPPHSSPYSSPHSHPHSHTHSSTPSLPLPLPLSSKRIKKKKSEKDQVLSAIENHNRTREKEKLPRQLFLRNLSYGLSVRALQFVFFYLAVSLLLYAEEDTSSGSGVASLQEIYPLHILNFALAVFSISAITTCLDYAVFYALEVTWVGHYDVVYYAYSLHGVLGHVISLVIVINLLSHMQVIQKLGSLHAFTTACLVVCLCYAMKEFYLRRHHKSLLQVRLKHKLTQMEEWTQILSKLGLSHISDDDDDEYEDDENDHIIPSTLGGSRSRSASIDVNFNPVLQECGLYQRNIGENNSQESIFVPPPPPVVVTVGLPGSPQSRRRTPLPSPSHSFSSSPSRSQRKSIDVESLTDDRQRFSFFSFLSKLFTNKKHKDTRGGDYMSSHGSMISMGEDPGDAEYDDQQSMFEEEHPELHATSAFWTQVNMIKSGHLKVSSRNGVVTIRSRKQAEAYGNKLFMHLTNGNTRPFTGASICDILRQHPSENTISELLPHVCHPLTPDRFNSTSSETGGLLDIECHALRLFRCSEVLEVDDEVVSQGVVVNAVVTVFKEIQFSRASLQDLNNLHNAAKSVVDFIFCIFMLLVVQIILRVDVSQVIAPLLTILFGLSFAFSPVLSNLFLSMAFVMFLLPFNVGNRVIIGKTEKIKGNVFEMSLMNTTLLTRHNEKLRIPNHVLFYEHIINLSEDMVATFEIPLVFALDGPLVCTQDKIHKFISAIQKYAKEDNKSEWIDVIVFCNELNYGANQVEYTFWCTHRASYQEVIRCYNGRTRMLEEMRRVQVELDIHLQKGLKLLP